MRRVALRAIVFRIVTFASIDDIVERVVGWMLDSAVN